MKREDRVFDEDLVRALEELPAQELERVNPFEEPIGRIALGLVLTTVQLEFLWLHYVLPTVGVLLLYLGFRTLRRENGWFRAGWLISLLKVACWAVRLWWAATPWKGSAWADAPWAGAVGLLVQVGYFLLLRQGLKEVFAKAEVERREDPLLLLAALTAVMAAVAVSPLSESWLAFLPTAGCYLYACYALYHLPASLDRAGYVLTAAPVRLSDHVVRWGWLAGCLALVLAGNLLAGHRVVPVQPWTPPPRSQLRAELTELGFPAELLAQLPEEEVARLEGAAAVQTSRETLMFDPLHRTRERSDGGETWMERWDVPGKINLETQMVFVELPGQRMYTALFFAWKEGGWATFWADGFTLEQWVYTDWTSGTRAEEIERVGGALLYEKGGQTWRGEMPGLEHAPATVDSTFFGRQERQLTTGYPCYPAGADNCRGYVTILADASEETGPNLYGGAVLKWYRTRQPFGLPFVDPLDRGAGSWNSWFRDHARLTQGNFEFH